MTITPMSVDLALSGAIDRSINDATGGLFGNAKDLANFANNISTGQIDKAIGQAIGLDSFGSINGASIGKALAAAAMGNPVGAVASFAMDALGIDPLGEIADAIGLGGLKDGVQNAIGQAKGALGDLAEKGLEGLGDAAESAVGGIGEALGDIGDAIGGAIGDVADAVGDAFGGSDDADSADASDAADNDAGNDADSDNGGPEGV